MERVDKIISLQTGYSRKDVKNLIHGKRVKINGEMIKITVKTSLKGIIKVNDNPITNKNK